MMEGGGGGPTGVHIGNPSKIHATKIFNLKKYLASKLSTGKNTRLSTVNTDLFNQTNFKT